MRILLLILLFLSSYVYSFEALEEEIEDFSFKFHVTGMLYKTSDNNLVPHSEYRDDLSSYDGEAIANAGALITYRAADWIGLKYYITTEDIMDYAFLDIPLLDNGRWGIRTGRVNRLSGFFSGFGPHTDHMNFLPAGSSPQRFNETFYRFDGVQLYGTYEVNRHLSLALDFTYGSPIVKDRTGLFDPTFFAIFSKEGFKVGENRPTSFFNFRVEYNDWQFFFDYINANINFDALFETTIKVSDVYPDIPAELDQDILISGLTTVPIYDVRTLKAGIGKSFDMSEVLITFFEQYGQMPSGNNKFQLGGVSLGESFKPTGASIVWRGHVSLYDIAYTGYSYYHLDLNSTNLKSIGIEVPKHIDYQHNVFIGYSHRVDEYLRVIGELQYNEGTATLSATYQDPMNSRKNWWVSSISASLVF